MRMKCTSANAAVLFSLQLVNSSLWTMLGEPLRDSRCVANEGLFEGNQMRCLGKIISVLICNLLLNPAFAQTRVSASELTKRHAAATALVACIRQDISKKSSAASSETSSLTVATAVEQTCRSQIQDVERASRQQTGSGFDQATFEREWRAAIAVAAQEVLTGASAHSLDLESWLKKGDVNRQFEQLLQANVRTKRVAAQTCLYSRINKAIGAAQETAQAVAYMAIEACKQELDRLNHASCLQVTGNNCTIDLAKANALQRHINEWGSAVTAAAASARGESQASR